MREHWNEHTEKESNMQLKKFTVTYRAVSKHRTIYIEACSKYDAKQRFYRMYPKYEVIKVEEVTGDE